jgi:hypothetical protein
MASKGDASKQWNDPPLPMRSSKKKAKAAYVAPAMTAFNPMGGGGGMAAPPMVGGGQPQQQQQQQPQQQQPQQMMMAGPPTGMPQQQQMQQQQQQQYQQQQYQQQQQQQQQHAPPQQQQQQQAPQQQQQQQQYNQAPPPPVQAAPEPPAPEPEEEEDAAPLPAMPTEFQPIVNMFNEKLQVCLHGQKNLTYKRKLEDAQKRFSPLYHAMAFRQVEEEFVRCFGFEQRACCSRMLLEPTPCWHTCGSGYPNIHSLTIATIKSCEKSSTLKAKGLHQLAYALQAKDYGTASNWHQYLLQKGTPPELSTTMIGIKGLIHVAKSMNV